MNTIPIPEEAIGRVGMVAALRRRVPDEHRGKRVVLCKPAGFVTTLVGSPHPVFAWHAHSLGGPIALHGKANRSLYVADACLSPVGQMTEAEIAALIRRQARQEFKEAARDLTRILEARPMTAQALDAAVDRAATYMAIEHALEEVATPVALGELGFKPDPQCQGNLVWVTQYEGVAFQVWAGSDPFGQWLLVATADARRQALWEEQLLPAQGPRGRVAQVLARSWKAMFPKAPVPDGLALGEVYGRHERELRKLDLGLPQLWVDPPVFRATLGWLRQRHADLVGAIQSLVISFEPGLLRLAVGGVSYGCPAQGRWVEACEIPLATFLAMPPEAYRQRRTICLERTLESLKVNGAVLPLGAATAAG